MRTLKEQRKLRHHRIRAKVSGLLNKPRFNVFRSNAHIYVQLIDDESGKTLVSASSHEIKAKGKKSEIASEVGKLAAEKALKAGIKEAVFDRGGYQYHGRIKQLADGARAQGLKI